MEPTIIGPYKATRMWNDVIAAFRQYLPIGRHRRYMKTFDNCFSGSGATDWLFQYLKSNQTFASDVSRQKCLALLNKLYKSGIFEEVKVSRNMRHKDDVQENRLYRFLPMSPSKIKIPRIPLAPRNDIDINQTGTSHKFSNASNLFEKKNVSSSETQSFQKENQQHKFKGKLSRKISFKKDKVVPVVQKEQVESNSPPRCHVMKRVLTTKEIKDTWRTVYLQELRKTLNIADLCDFMDTDQVDGYYVMHNCIYLNKSGVVTNVPTDDQLPHWVVSAMKCLARWPEPPEPGLPNYPGFEKDVFNVVKDYFTSQDEPLIPFIIYDLITDVFVMAGNNFLSSASGANDGFSDEDEEDSSTVPSLWTSASLENIILNLTKKYCKSDSTEQLNNAFSLEDLRRPNSVQRLRFDNQEDLRFADHVDHTYADYDLSAFPSTDGLDKLAQSRRSNPCLNARHSFDFDSCPSFPGSQGPSALSRTTHSAGEAFPQSRAFSKSKMGRKFGSTPNLPKVSRYETAFGPDNKTVTRIYFQKGVSTDRLHVERETESSSSQRETCFGAYPNNMNESSNANEVFESESMHKPSSHDSSQQVLRGAFVGRSKSFANVNESTSKSNKSFEIQSSNPNVVLRPRNIMRDNTSSSLYDSSESINWCRNSTQRSSTQSRSSMNVATYQHGHSRSYRNSVSDTERARSMSARTTNRISAYIEHPASSPLRDILEDVSSYGPGYKPILDRGKVGRSISASDAPLQEREARSNQSHFLRKQVTSTPMMTPHHSNAWRQQQQQGSTYSLNNITPFHAMDSSHRYQGQASAKSYVNFPQTRLSESRAKTSLQLILLLLPPANRRKLHMLFKMMSKMTANPNLCLDPTQTTRSLVLGTFYKAIVNSMEEQDFDEFVVLQLVSFMLDYYEEVLCPPAHLKATVSDRLKVMQKPQMVYAPQPVTQFCQQVSVSDFENQSRATSLSALGELLERIVADRKMTLKEKKKRMKQFQRTYPEIYSRRFPTPEAEAQVLPVPKVKPPLMTKSLTKLKALRL